MKKYQHSFILLSLIAWATVAVANGTVIPPLGQDTVGIRAQIDSAFSLREKNFKAAYKLSAIASLNARASKSKELIKLAVYNGALLDWYEGAYVDGIEKCYENLSLSKQLIDSAGIADSYSLLGLIYLYKADYDSALHHFDKSLFYYKKVRDTTQVIKAYGFKSLIYNKQGDYLRAKENLLSTVLLKRQHSTANWYVLNVSEDKEVSEKYYKESLIDAKKNLQKLEGNVAPTMAKRNAYRNVGVSYLRLNYLDSALAQFKKSAKTAELINANVFWIELAGTYARLGYYDSAIWCNSKAIANTLDHGSRGNLADCYVQLGNSYKSKGEYKNAIEAYKKASSLHLAMGHKYAQLDVMLRLSKVLQKDNDINQALAYTDSAVSMAHIIDTRKGLSQALLSRYHLFKLKRDYKKAFEVKEVYDVLRDSLQKEKVQLDLAKLDLHNDLELGKLKISELNKQHELSKANLENQKLIVVIVLIVSFFVTSLLLLNYFKTRKLGKLIVKLNKQQVIIGNQNKDLIGSNKEKELLLGEIHHRVKNNLQVISSLLSLQERNISDATAKAAIFDGKERVKSMGLIHNMLYQQNNFSGINMSQYIEKLILGLLDSFGKKPDDFELNYDIRNINLDVDTAIPLGLIINELVVNALKHAYKITKKPKINIDLKEVNSQLILKIKDNGTGVVSDIRASQSFGMKLVNSLSRQLSGTFDVEQQDGLCFKVAINDYKLIV